MMSSAKISLPAPRLPRRFGRYTLFDVIGRGGMAEIFLSREKMDLGGHRLCVVKQIIATFAEHPQFAEMLVHEAKLAARLDHANIVQVYDLGRDEGQLYIAMEYVEGYDLNELLRRCTKAKVPFPFEFALLIVGDVLRGLDYAHRRTDEHGQPLGIVHRDVSPSNVLISYEGHAKLCDFGIAHANEMALQAPEAADDGAPPVPGRRLREALQGKAGYMSPEHARGEPLDARADVFAAGIVLWELVAGHRLYRQDADKGTLLEQARKAEVPALPPRGLPDEAELHRIIMKALSPTPDPRYPSAGAMLRDLDAYVGKGKLGASRLRLGEWLVDKFGADLVKQRRMRQRAAEALEKGPPVVLTPLPPVEPAAPGPPSSRAPIALRPVTAPTGLGVAPIAAAKGTGFRPQRSPAFWFVLVVVVSLGVAWFSRR
jgi:serine/threonine protein kinase